MKTLLKSIFAGIILILIAAALYLRTPAGERFDHLAAGHKAQDYDVRIIRDAYGVPHVFGKTDADTAFGFAYAHAEDDWTTIQDVVIAARGMSAQYKGKDVAPQDYLYDLFKISESVERGYEHQVSAEAQVIARAYADGLNLYASENLSDILPGILPVSEHDILAGFAWATPFFYRLDGELTELFTAEDKPNVSPWSKQSSRLSMPEAVRGSNGFAVAPSRTADGHTRVIVNSHQPMTGPYAWYEAHLVSEEGMNIIGATFPGVPIVVQGAKPDMAWVHTVNLPDLVDIYALEVDDAKKPKTYKLDGEWTPFERSESKFRVKLFGPFSLPVKRDVLWSHHGPVLSTPTGHYAIRYAGMAWLEKDGPVQNLGALDQWLAMNKAENVDEWRAALNAQGVLSFNMIYGDKLGNIGSVYNARMPDRIEGPEWAKILPGDRSELIWSDYKSVSDLPELWNPECGWVFSANSTPFSISDAECNNHREDFSKTFGIEDRVTNRSRRALDLLSPDKSITREELLSYRADTRYHPESQLMKLVVELVTTKTDDPLLQQAQELLRNWDGNTNQESRGAALAIISGTRILGYEYIEPPQMPMENLLKSAQDLKDKFGRIDPEWGEVNRLVRGDVNLPLDGGPDILRAIYADRDGVSKSGVMSAFSGDTHILIADWNADGDIRVDSVHNFGSSTNVPTSPHYSDQTDLFAKGTYKPMSFDIEAIKIDAVRDYRPGKE